MRRFLPSFAALQCFEAAARHLNFTRAAEELHLTQSAVSRQVRALEDFVQRQLFRRVGKKLVLTETGAAFAGEVGELLNRLEAATIQAITGNSAEGTLTVGTLPTFGARWLIPRLTGFAAQHPHIQLNLVTRTTDFDFAGEEVDIAIQYGDGAWPQCRAEALLEEEMVVAAAPNLVSSAQADDPGQVAHHVMLQLASRRHAWAEWLRAKGVEGTGGIYGPCFEHFSMMIQAARDGMGLAVVPKIYIEDELHTGSLVAPFGAPVKSRRGYYVVYPESKATQRKVIVFRDWLRQAT